MLYLVAHSFFNGQSKNSNLFPLPELHETQFKQNRGALGTRMTESRVVMRDSAGPYPPSMGHGSG